MDHSLHKIKKRSFNTIEDKQNVFKISQPKQRSSKIPFAIIIISLIVVAILFFINLPVNCKNDSDCFYKNSKTCSKAKVDTEKDRDLMRYNILGSKKDTCVLKITKLKVSEDKSKSFREALEGRDMKCAVPLNILQKTKITEITNINDYCTGPLKEAVLEINLQKMYELIIKNLGNVTSTLQDVIVALQKK